MVSIHASGRYTPTSVGALMDPAFLRRAVMDYGDPAGNDTRASALSPRLGARCLACAMGWWRSLRKHS